MELVNGARTLALMEEGCRKHRFWSERDISSVRRWYGNECWAFDSGQYGTEPSLWEDPAGEQDLNPWEDSDDPRTQEVAGFLPDAPGNGLGVIIESPVESRIMDSNRIEPLELVITGTVVAGTDRGEHVYLKWLTQTLTDPLSFRTGWTATVFSHCPVEEDWAAVADPLDIPADDAGEPARTTWDDPASPTLDEFTDPTPFPLDSGLWQLFDVRFVSIDPLTDGPLFPHCVGRRYAIRFTVKVHRWFDRPRTLATLGGTGNWATGETFTNPLQVGSAALIPDPLDPGPPGLAVPTSPGSWPGLRSLSSRWALPDSCMRVAALTPPRAATLQDRLVVTVTNPSLTKTVHNARVRFWEAFVGYAPPDTVPGDEFYRDRTPDAEIRVVRLGPAETIVFDGRTGRSVLSTPGRIIPGVAGRVEGPSGARVEPPVLRCDRRFWVAAEMSSSDASYGDLDLEVTVKGAQQDIPT